MMYLTRLIILFFSLLFFHNGNAQEFAPPFYNEIRQFKKQDSLRHPPANAILFVGSSSFRLWKTIHDDFPGNTIINRGFGGSSLTDIIRYKEEIIYAYEPRQIVIYCGENDIAASDTVTGNIVFERFKELFSDIRSRYPDVPVVFVSMKPSPSRWHMKQRLIEGNELIRKFLKKKKRNATFVDVWKHMLGPDGKPWDALFTEDKLHMNELGYEIWKKRIGKALSAEDDKRTEP